MFTDTVSNASPLYILDPDETARPQHLTDAQLKWIDINKLHPKEPILVPDGNGHVHSVVLFSKRSFWDVATLPRKLPAGSYAFGNKFKSSQEANLACLAWGLAFYQFDHFKEQHRRSDALLCWPDQADKEHVMRTLNAVIMVRDLVNRPANDLNPDTFASYVIQKAEQWGAQCRNLKGESLLHENYPCLYAFGQAASVPPHLVDLTWGDPSNPSLYIIGKGVCFDSGGLNLKPGNGMRFMKKDMGGAAHALALAQMIITAQLPVNLRVMLPIIENSVSGSALRPGDILRTRAGKTVEIGNTDAEGRVVMTDCLEEAAENKPDLIIDCATLTGAARVALGPDVPAFFTNRTDLASSLMKASEHIQDPVWQLPIFEGYRDLMSSPIADLSNDGKSGYAGAITAAIYLEKMIADNPWIHMDMMAWNPTGRPGRPEGGEAQGLRALYTFLQDRYKP